MASASSSGTADLVAIPVPESCWKASEVTEDTLEELKRCGLIGSKATLAWKAPEGHRIPCEDHTETVVFMSFFERGLGIPTGDFFRGLLQYYGIEVTVGTFYDSQINPQAHGYRCSFHPGVFQGIDFRGEREVN